MNKWKIRIGKAYAQELSGQIIESVITDIQGRKGIGDEWDDIDSKIQDEIINEWNELVVEIISGA